ncbi:MAG: ATP-binding protein [Myxococcota bacterium]
MLGLVTVVAAGMLLGMEVGLRRELRERLVASIDESAQRQSDGLRETFEHLLAGGHTLVAEPRLRAALSAPVVDSKALEALADELRDVQGWELLGIADAHGARRLRGASSEGAWPVVANAALGGKTAKGYWVDGGHLYQIAATPVTLDRRTIGALVGGVRLSASRVARHERTAHAALAAFADGRLLAASFAPGSAQRTAVERLAKAKAPPRLKLAREWFLVREVPITESGCRMLVFRSEDVALAPYRRLRGLVLAVSASAYALAILAAWLIARGLSGPVANLERQRQVTQQLFDRSEERFRQLIERASDAIAVYGDGRFVYVNPALVALLGYAKAEELVGKLVMNIVHPDDRDDVASRLRTLAETGEPLPPHEVRYLRRDGGVVTAEVATQAIEFRNRPALLTIARDVTERRQMQARMFQTDRMTSLGTLAAGVAHEINNPLAYLIANLDFVSGRLDQLSRDNPSLQVGPAPTRPGRVTGSYPQVGGGMDEVLEPLKEAREGAERVRQIVRDLKTFSRPDDDRRVPVDVRRILESSINVAFNEIRPRARLVKDYGEVPQVEANEARLGQVFLNLLLNAAQAIPEGDAAKNEIRVTTRTEGERVVVELRDTGGGIPPEVLGRIFDPFFTTKPVGVGTGLGLSICHNLVTSLGGEIAVDSQVGRGTTVRIALPQLKEPRRRRATTPALVIPPGPRARVLVIDDEPALGRALGRALSPDHEVRVATSGREGLDILLADGRFDVVFCDLTMPDVTGMDVFEELRRSRPGFEERLVFITGGAFTSRASDFLSSVPNLRIEKPFDMQIVRAIVRERILRA